jgi:hypothetical protein
MLVLANFGKIEEFLKELKQRRKTGERIGKQASASEIEENPRRK